MEAGGSRSTHPPSFLSRGPTAAGLYATDPLEPALSAAVADPLWLLCRQWQFLEFAGEDAGTPIDVRVEGEQAVLSSYLPGGSGGGATGARDLTTDPVPLEVVVESEPVRPGHPRLAVEAGLQLQWMLNSQQLNELFVVAYPLQAAPPTDPEIDRYGADWWELAGNRGLDARLLATALAPLRDAGGRLTGLPPDPVVPAELRDRTLAALNRWLAWYDGVLVDPSTTEAWRSDRLEYAFALSARTSTAAPVFGAGWRSARVGAHNCVALRDLPIFVEQPAEPVTPADTYVSDRAWVGK